MRPGRLPQAASAVLAISLPFFAACSGGSGDSSQPGPAVAAETPQCNGSCASSSTFLTIEDVQNVIARAVAEAQTRNAGATIAVVDRVGNVLGVFAMNGAPMSVTVTSNNGVTGGLENVNIIPSTLAAIAKAVTGAYLSSEGNAFSTRTASQIVQSHFNPGEILATSGPLSGVQFSQLPCSDLNLRFNAGAPDAGPKRSPLGLSADPGGFPLYKGGTPVGAVGIVADGVYGLDLNVQDSDTNLDEAIALAASFGLAAPDDRRADRLTVEGKLLRFSDMAFADMQAPTMLPPAFADINGTTGSLQAVPGYTDGTIQAGTAFGQPASGIRPDALDYPGLDAFVLVDNANVERFRPRAGTESSAALTADEARTILAGSLRIANRARAQIRRPLGSPARVTITLVDSSGVILGIVRGRDAPMFGIDVSVQKARAAAFFSNPQAAAALTALPPAVYLNQGLTVLRSINLGDYVTALRGFTGMPNALGDGQVAFTARAVGNLARPFYPDGADGSPAGPLAKPAGEWSPFSTGIQLDLVYNAIVHHVAFVLGAAPDVTTNCTGESGFDSGFTSVAPLPALANGIQIFPGSVPVYRDRQLVGAVGVSGDGVEQDDMIAFLGVQDGIGNLGGFAQAPSDLRADQFTPAGSRLRYVACPQAPFIDSQESEPCRGF